MGNTIRRTFTNERSTTMDWSETSVLRLISEKKLAPKTSSTTSKNSEECPICFLEFNMLNSASCCKQSICTDCVVQLKQPTATNNKSKSLSTINTSCPFCGKKEFEVHYNENNNSNVVENKLTTSSNCVPHNNILSPIKNINGNTNTTTNNNDSYSSRSNSSSANSTYLTPEQERKLRSHSIDSTSTLILNDTTINTTSTCRSNTTTSATNNNNISNLPPLPPLVKSASKSDRIALEEQMKSQRLQYSTEHCNEEIKRYSSTTNTNNNNRSSNNSSRNDNLTNRNSAARYNSYSVRIPYRHNSRTSNRIIYGNSSESSSPSQTSTTNNTQQSSSATRSALNQQFFHSIQDILGNSTSGVHDISSIEELEELMLMEAVRQSMNESAPSSPQSSSNNNINNDNNNSSGTNKSSSNIHGNNNSPARVIQNTLPIQSVIPTTSTSPTNAISNVNNLSLDDIHIEDTHINHHTHTATTTTTVTPVRHDISTNIDVQNHLDERNDISSHDISNANNNNKNDNDTNNDDFFNSDDDAEDEELKIALALSMVDFS